MVRSSAGKISLYAIVLKLHVLAVAMTISQFTYCHGNSFFAVCDASPIGSCSGKWRDVFRHARYSFQTILRPPQASIVSHTSTAHTQRKCVDDCTARQSHSLYYFRSTGTCHCNVGKDSNSGIVTDATPMVYGVLESYREEFSNGTKLTACLRPPEKDCLQLYKQGYTEDGVYTIHPIGGASVDAWCDMNKGGWTVFQRREDGSEDFYRTWNDYVNGFGNRCGEYWLGLETIHLLTKESSEMVISMESFGDVSPTQGYAEYTSFAISNADTKYTLMTGGFNGNCGDSMSHHNGRMFTTRDQDNDQFGENCAQAFKGAWWYGGCHHANLNGLYLGGVHDSYADGMNWHGCWGHNYSLKKTVMKVRRL